MKLLTRNKRNIKTTILFPLLTSCIIFTYLLSCNKKELAHPIINYSDIPETNVHIVSDSVALLVAEKFNPSNFFSNRVSNVSGSRVATNSTEKTTTGALEGINKIKNRFVISDSAGFPAIYIYNFEDQKGFVCVSADSGMSPILAYIEKGEYTNKDGLGLNRKWLLKTIYNIGLVRKNLHDNKRLAAIAWQNYFSPIVKNNSISTGQSGGYRINPAPPPPPDPCTSDPNYYSFANQTIGPLLSTEWGQDSTYNSIEQCQFEGNYNILYNPHMGTASIAMAQIMYYHQSPSSAYGHTYSYASMPYNYGNSYNRVLIDDAAKSINTDFCNTSLPSPDEGYWLWGAHSNALYSERISNSLKSNFSYTYADYAGYNQSSSYPTVVSQILDHKPIILFGYNDWDPTLGIPSIASGSLFWVCDGINQSNITYCYNGSSVSEQILYFHFNFGKEIDPALSSTSPNGWYAFDDWGSYQYNYFDEIIYNISQ